MPTQTGLPENRRAARHRRSLLDWVDANLKWILTVPAIVFVALLIAFPIGYTVFLSLTDSAFKRGAQWEQIRYAMPKARRQKIIDLRKNQPTPQIATSISASGDGDPGF